MTDSPIRLQCPTCQKSLKLKRAVPAGKKITCPNCETVFPASLAPTPKPRPKKAEPAVESRRAHSEPKSVAQNQSNSSSSPLLIAVLIVLALVLVGGGIGVGIMMSRGNNDQVAANEDEKENFESQSDDKGDEEGKQAQKNDSDVKQGSNSEEPNENNKRSESSLPNGNQSTSTNGNESSSENNTKQNAPAQSGNGAPKNDAFDPNRPSAKPNNGLNPNQPPVAGQNAGANGGNNVPMQSIPAPIIIEVPVLIPVNSGTNSSSSTAAKPAVNVVIQAVDASASTLIVDHQTKPGVSDEMTVTLDETPDADVTITIEAEQGLAVDNKTLTFKKGAAPTKQSVKVNGDGKANLGSGPTKILFLTVSASGSGLDATAPAKIPVQVNRRIQWAAITGAGVKAVAAAGRKKAFWEATGVIFPARFALPNSDAYTREFVELAGPKGLRFRFFSDRVEKETTIRSGIFTTLLFGSWR